MTTNNKRSHTNYTDQQKQILRPVAEMLAIRDGNAFFGLELEDGSEWYEQYLPDAQDFMECYYGRDFTALYGRVSWLMDLEHENAAVEQAYNQWQMVKKLSQ